MRTKDDRGEAGHDWRDGKDSQIEWRQRISLSTGKRLREQFSSTANLPLLSDFQINLGLFPVRRSI